MVSFPYYSHIFRDSYWSGMGIVWETYHKKGPIIGGPWKNPTDETNRNKTLEIEIIPIKFQMKGLLTAGSDWGMKKPTDPNHWS